MAVIIAGIDEAGYGPMLGPLCVGLAVFRVSDAAAEEGKAPDLWKLLSKGVCRSPCRGGQHDKRGRIAVADSKELKLSNSVKTTHPLVHLERGVLSFLACRAGAEGMPAAGGLADDCAMFEALGARLDAHPCYAGEGRALPVSMQAGELAIATNMLRGALAGAGVELLDLRCTVIDETTFNRTISEKSNKAEATALAVGEHLRHVWERWGQERDGQRLGVVCDRLGGRDRYGGLLEREVSGAAVEVVEEADLRSRYVVRGTGADGEARRLGAAFLVEGEAAHMPVALASMTAKYVRELAMARFNDYWSTCYKALMGAEMKPTAGYSQDARRWLKEMGEVLPASDRRALVRLL